MKIKRIIAGVLSAILLLCIVPQISVKAASTTTINFAELKVTELSDMDDIGMKAEGSWSVAWNFTDSKDGEEQYSYGKFTIPKDSIVCISASVENPGTFPTYKYYLYGTESMGTEIDHQHNGTGVFDTNYTDVRYTYYELKAGTYYVKSVCNSEFSDYVKDAYSKLTIAYVPTDKSVKFSKKVNKTKTKTTVTVNEKFIFGEAYSLQYVKGRVGANDSSWKSAKDISTATNSFTVSKNGWYTIKIKDKQNGTYWYRYVKITGIDKTKPTVTGVKNGKKYKKTVTIKFKDNKKGSGIKKATLNGKKIKSGKKVSKKGKYTLVVTDKAGNKKTIKFTIK